MTPMSILPALATSLPMLILILCWSPAPARSDGVSAYGEAVKIIQASTLSANARLRELSDRIYKLEEEAIKRNTRVKPLTPLKPITYQELGCVGQNDGCCTKSSPCGVGQGDCDSGHECLTGLVCGHDNCPKNISVHNQRHLFNHGDDCCEEREAPCLGGDDCCTGEAPCDLGEGDCDFDSDCRGALVCGSANCGEGFDFEEGSDCCMEKPPEELEEVEEEDEEEEEEKEEK